MQGRRPLTRSRVAAGSVWETRMKMDEVKGGIKVFNGDDESRSDGGSAGAGNDDEDGLRVYTRMRRNQSDGGGSAEKRKRKSWRAPEPPAALAGSSPVRKSLSDLVNSPKKATLLVGGGDEMAAEAGDEIETKRFDDKEIDLPAEKPVNAVEEKQIHQIHETPPSPPPVIHQHAKHPEPPKPPSPPPTIHQEPLKPPTVELEEEELIEQRSAPPPPRHRMQNIVDLVMWRDISRTTFIFGIGTFLLLSSSYTRDLNFSFVSAISYLGLVYLAGVFLYRSAAIRRGEVFDEMDERPVVGEEEAIRVLRLLLPYMNELLIKLRTLFSGDPATTMKMAVLLFVTARCGSSITAWTLAKLVFFGVFTVPKICSSYQGQLVRYGTFWLERFRDGWESCTHKRAVAAAAFTLVWNVSSTVARVWAVFMLLVAVRLYQQRAAEGWAVEEEEEVAETVVVEEDSKQQQLQRGRWSSGPRDQPTRGWANRRKDE